MSKRLFPTTLFLFLSLASFLSATSVDSKIHPWVLTHTNNGQSAEFFVVLNEQADLSPAQLMVRKADKGRFVFDALTETARRSQAPLIDWLESQGIEYRSFYIINAILLRGDRKLVETLALRDDVARIEGNPEIRNNLPEPDPNARDPKTPEAIEWSIDRVNAPDLWARGFTGQGIVVGGADTGYRWTHNALKGKYRGWNGTTADHDYNWHDSVHSGGGICGANAPAPCDDNGHGTHTMGTVAGDDGVNNQIGMAPGAKWIGCRNMNQGNGTPATYIECFEFFLAPYPVGGDPETEGDPSKAPDLTTNSWSCPPSEGCSALSLEAAINAQEAAGIMTVVAAQNAGSACGTVNDPPALYQSAYAIGSTTSAANNELSSFSSRGPADTTGLMKPAIVAPGSSIRSASNSSDSSYVTLSGTSMATPNVAGGVALLWSALSQYLNDQDATETLLSTSALRIPGAEANGEDCGGDYVNGPNNSWGYGLLDVLNAYNSACPGVSEPQNLASSITVNQDISLTWDAAPSATEYQVYRGSGACPGTGFSLIGSSNTTTFLDTNVMGGATYSYRVRTLVNACASILSNCTDETIACDFSIAPQDETYSAAGGQGTVNVTATDGCNWTAVSNDSWITVTSGSNGTGNGVVEYSVDSNAVTSPRTGTITIAGSTFTVNQDAFVPGCLFCDDFEDSVMPNWNFSDAGWTETGGNLVGTPVKRKTIAAATPVFGGCLQCTIQAVIQTSGGEGNRIWLLGWYSDKNNTMELLIKEENDRVVLKQRSGGSVIRKAKGLVAIEPGTNYTVQISFDGAQFAVSVDGTQVLTLTPVGAPVAGTTGFQVKRATGTFGEIVVN
jgi:subtilisin family serine protease